MSSGNSSLGLDQLAYKVLIIMHRDYFNLYPYVYRDDG